LACADQWADAVAVGGQAALHGTPVLLVDRDRVPQETSQILARFPDAERVVIGGSGVISDQVLAEVGGRRIAGTDRADTGVQVMRQLWGRSTGGPGEHLILTPGWSPGGWQAALAHSTYAARFHAPLLFVADEVPGVVQDALAGLSYTPKDSPTLRFDQTVPEGVRAAVRGLTGQ
jgi:putative cell wall-binding protein